MLSYPFFHSLVLVATVEDQVLMVAIILLFVVTAVVVFVVLYSGRTISYLMDLVSLLVLPHLVLFLDPHLHYAVEENVYYVLSIINYICNPL